MSETPVLEHIPHEEFATPTPEVAVPLSSDVKKEKPWEPLLDWSVFLQIPLGARIISLMLPPIALFGFYALIPLFPPLPEFYPTNFIFLFIIQPVTGFPVLIAWETIWHKVFKFRPRWGGIYGPVLIGSAVCAVALMASGYFPHWSYTVASSGVTGAAIVGAYWMFPDRERRSVAIRHLYLRLCVLLVGFIGFHESGILFYYLFAIVAPGYSKIAVVSGFVLLGWVVSSRVMRVAGLEHLGVCGAFVIDYMELMFLHLVLHQVPDIEVFVSMPLLQWASVFLWMFTEIPIQKSLATRQSVAKIVPGSSPTGTSPVLQDVSFWNTIRDRDLLYSELCDDAAAEAKLYDRVQGMSDDQRLRLLVQQVCATCLAELFVPLIYLAISSLGRFGFEWPYLRIFSQAPTIVYTTALIYATAWFVFNVLVIIAMALVFQRVRPEISISEEVKQLIDRHWGGMIALVALSVSFLGPFVLTHYGTFDSYFPV